MNMNETLRLILTNKNPVRNVRKAKERAEYDLRTPAQKLMNVQPPGIYVQDFSEPRPTNEKKAVWEYILNNASVRAKRKKKKKDMKVLTVLNALSPVTVEPLSRSKREVFHIHNELDANEPVKGLNRDAAYNQYTDYTGEDKRSPLKRDEDKRSPLKRSKSERIPKKNKENFRKKIKRSNSFCVVENPYSYVQDLETVMQDEISDSLHCEISS